MFDTVICKREMPDGKEFDSFQTKSLDSFLDTYIVTGDGKLMTGSRFVEFHGWLNIYGSEGSCNIPGDYKLYDYMLKFTDGSLQEILTLDEYRNRHAVN